MNCTRCNKHLSRKTARLIDGKVICSAAWFMSGAVLRSSRRPTLRLTYSLHTKEPSTITINPK
jgi:hypothetical protein